MSSRSLLLLAEVVIGLSCLGLALVIVGARLHRVRATRRTARMVAPHRPMLLAVASGEDAEGSARAHLASLPAATWEHVRSTTVAMLAKVRGAPAETLVSLLHAHAEVERALGWLRSRSAVRRARAAYLLGLLHDPANVPALVPLLSDPSPDVRLVAARSLGLIGDAAAAGAVLSAVPSRDGRMGIPAWVAAEALLGMGLGVAPVLGEALASEDAGVRDVAVTVAGAGTFTSVLPQLRVLLDHDPSPEVRIGAAVALGRLGGPRDVATLIRRTAPSSPTTLRRTCVGALGELGDPSAVPALTALLDEPDRRLAELGAEALVRVGPAGTEVLLRCAGSTGPVGAVARGALDMARLRGQLLAAVR